MPTDANTARGGPGAYQRAKTHCPRGHPYDRVYEREGGTRRSRGCSICQRESELRSRERKKAKRNRWKR